MLMGLRSAKNNPMVAGTKGTKRVFEYHSRNITFAVALRLHTILASRAFLAAFDPSLSTCYRASEDSDWGRTMDMAH